MEMKSDSLTQIARDIIRENIYLTLSSTDGAVVWATPLYYAVSDTYTFYFISQMTSLHIIHILRNPKVSFAIFDYHQKEGTGNGVQGSGKAYLMNEKELGEAFTWYHSTYIPLEKESFTGKAPYRFFKLIPEHFFVLDPDKAIDVRVEVKIM